MRRPATASLVAACVGLAGCLGPLVDDDVPPLGLILPAGTQVESAHDDPEVDRQIADNDGVDGVVALRSAFANGQPVRYWSFGTVPAIAAPIFVLVRPDGNGEMQMLPHNTIVDTIPGDSGYSPYWAVWTVEVTEHYNDEILPSVAAIQEAQQLGLVKAPVRQEFAVNCPGVATDVTLDVGTGTPMAPTKRFYWKGKTVRYYDFGPMPLDSGVLVPEQPIYVLRREGSEPLSEPRRGVDITGDGDIADTNDLFSYAADHVDATPLCRTVQVAVPATYGSIDTSGDENVADFMAATDLFNPDPVPGNVVAYEVTDELWNCPQQVAP